MNVFMEIGVEKGDGKRKRSDNLVNGAQCRRGVIRRPIMRIRETNDLVKIEMASFRISGLYNEAARLPKIIQVNVKGAFSSTVKSVDWKSQICELRSHPPVA